MKLVDNEATIERLTAENELLRIELADLIKTINDRISATHQMIKLFDNFSKG